MKANFSVREITRFVVAAGLVALLPLAATVGCGGQGLTRGYSALCSDGQLDFGNSCSSLCFGHGDVVEYYQKCR